VKSEPSICNTKTLKGWQDYSNTKGEWFKSRRDGIMAGKKWRRDFFLLSEVSYIYVYEAPTTRRKGVKYQRFTLFYKNGN
jgi:hypothetical protein